MVLPESLCHAVPAGSPTHPEAQIAEGRLGVGHALEGVVDGARLGAQRPAAQAAVPRLDDGTCKRRRQRGQCRGLGRRQGEILQLLYRVDFHSAMIGHYITYNTYTIPRLQSPVHKYNHY